jgi:uncharacterized membrane protein YphA (DoxX/SURF4 family)
LLVVVDRWTRPALIGLFALYLSYVYAGQDFMSFQWDVLLLEAGFLAIFLTGGSRIVVWLYRWLVFRYLFLAGIMKLLSGDPTWHGLTALEYHFWTQPLPTPLAWYAAQLPPWLLIGGTAATLIIELGSVLLIFLPRRLRAVAACCVLLLQSLIVLTGNYNFFNLLTMLLCVFLFDDVALGRLNPTEFGIVGASPRPAPRARGNRDRNGAGTYRGAGRPKPDLAGVYAYRFTCGRCSYAGSLATADRQSLRAIRRHDNHPT